MIILYHCYGAAHSSVTAAAIHLGLLPRDCRPTAAQLLAVPRYDKTLTRELGTPFLMGEDHWRNSVYILGRGSGPRVVGNLLISLAQIHHLPASEILFVNALPRLTATTTIGGTLSRGLGLIWPGRALTIAGIRMCYFRFVNLVQETEHIIETILAGKEETCVKLEN